MNMQEQERRAARRRALGKPEEGRPGKPRGFPDEDTEAVRVGEEQGQTRGKKS